MHAPSCHYISSMAPFAAISFQLCFSCRNPQHSFFLSFYATMIMAGSSLVVGVAVLLILFVARYVLYPAFLSPLAKIPNAHPLAPYTGLWMLWIRYQEKVNKTVNAAHQRSGPVVRLGPSELSVNCIENGVKTIYGTKTFPKHHFYNAFRNFG